MDNEELIKIVNSVDFDNQPKTVIDRLVVMPKRVFAVEKHQLLIKANYWAVFSIVGLIFVAVLSIWERYAGAVLSGIITCAYAWYITSNKNEMRRLEQKYNIEPPKPIINVENIK